MSLIPAKTNFTIWRGATFRKRITLLTAGRDSDPRDLSNYTGLLEVRARPNDLAVLLTFDETGDEDGLIEFGDENGTIDLVIEASVTSTLAWTHGVYDLTITAPAAGDTDALLYGAISVKGV